MMHYIKYLILNVLYYSRGERGERGTLPGPAKPWPIYFWVMNYNEVCLHVFYKQLEAVWRTRKIELLIKKTCNQKNPR